MKHDTNGFKAANLLVTPEPGDGPRGGRLAISTTDGKPARLLEGEARRLHLWIRNWVKGQKFLRGDTQRGREKVEERREQYSAAARVVQPEASHGEK